MGPGFCPEFGCRALPALSVWQGSGFAADQTNAMLAVGGTSYISLISVAAADENSLTPLHRLLPAETASLGFGGSPVGGGDKTPISHFFGTSMWGRYYYPLAAVAVSEQPRAGFISAEKRLSQSGCSVPTNALFPPAHSAFLAPLCGGWYHYPRRALHAVETLDARGSRRRIRRFYAVSEFAPCGLNVPSAGTQRHPSPKPRTQRLTRRNTGRFHRLRHRQGR